jgi:tetratricopeptide (TPR) repeat protein
MAAYEHLLRARQCMRRYTRRDELAARAHLERALELEPGYAAAYAALALSHIHEYESTWSEAPHAAVDRAYELGRHAVGLDETDSTAHRAFAYAALYRGRWELAGREIDRAIALNPNDYPNFCVKSWLLLFSGQPAAALACLDEALRLNPFAPDNCYLSIGIAQYTARRYVAAAETFGRMSSWDTLRYTGLAACHGQLAHPAEARAAAARLAEAVQWEFGSEADDPMARWRSYVECMFPFRVPDDLQHLRDGLGKAGLTI